MQTVKIQSYNDFGYVALEDGLRTSLTSNDEVLSGLPDYEHRENVYVDMSIATSGGYLAPYGSSEQPFGRNDFIINIGDGVIKDASSITYHVKNAGTMGQIFVANAGGNPVTIRNWEGFPPPRIKIVDITAGIRTYDHTGTITFNKVLLMAETSDPVGMLFRTGGTGQFNIHNCVCILKNTNVSPATTFIMQSTPGSIIVNTKGSVFSIITENTPSTHSFFQASGG